MPSTPTAVEQPEAFSLSVVADGGEIAVVPTGDLDLVSAEVLERAVRKVQAGAVHIILDLRRVDFIDSTGLRVLIGLRNDAKRMRHRLSLMAGPPAVQRIFKLTATHGLFDWREP